MENNAANGSHEAAAAALGFYYQAQFALLTLLNQDSDDASVAVERLDDIEIAADGQTLLYQLKHSIKSAPPPITLSCVALWKTLRVWIDALPSLTLAETKLHLVAVGSIPDQSPLLAWTSDSPDYDKLHEALETEAQRVMDEREVAKEAKQPLPHADRAVGCEAFLDLVPTLRQTLIRRICIQPNSPSITTIDDEVVKLLRTTPPEQRHPVAIKLLEWWDLQVVYSLCGKRSRVISKLELLKRVSAAISEIEENKLLPDFARLRPPESYEVDDMLLRQIGLVGGKPSDVDKATREQWRAQEQRAKWITDNVAMGSIINDHDDDLIEHWEDLHQPLSEDDLDDEGKRAAGLELLHWSHNKAHLEVVPIKHEWTAPYYVRGTYQILSITLKVGWHPDYLMLLKEEQ